MHTQHAAAALRHLAHDIAHHIVGYGRHQIADGLQQHGVCLGQRRLVGQLRRHLKRHFGGIHRVIAAVQQRRLQADNGIPRQHAMAHSLLQALFHRREIVFRHAAAEHTLGKDKVALCRGLELDPHVTKLPMAAGLLFVASLRLALPADGFAVRDARLGERDLYAELVLQPGADHIQMLLAKAGDDLLHSLGIDTVF